MSGSVLIISFTFIAAAVGDIRTLPYQRRGTGKLCEASELDSSVTRLPLKPLIRNQVVGNILANFRNLKMADFLSIAAGCRMEALRCISPKLTENYLVHSSKTVARDPLAATLYRLLTNI